MIEGDSFATSVVSCLPKLAVYATRLARSLSAADDLVQETMLRAFLHADQFTPGSNLEAWLTIILRNIYFNDLRGRRRLQHLEAEEHETATDQPQLCYVFLREIQREIEGLPADQGDALLLVAVNGKSYEEAANDFGCALGTIKSRVSRARSGLLNQHPWTDDERPCGNPNLSGTRKRPGGHG